MTTTPDTTSVLVPLFLLAIAVLAAGVLIQPHIARARRARQARRQAAAWQPVTPADDDEMVKDVPYVLIEAEAVAAARWTYHEDLEADLRQQEREPQE